MRTTAERTPASSPSPPTMPGPGLQEVPGLGPLENWTASSRVTGLRHIPPASSTGWVLRQCFLYSKQRRVFEIELSG